MKASAKSDGASGREESATLIAQEWLFNPCYEIWVRLPEPYQDELAGRLRDRRWHFSPYLGVSEMLADLEFRGEAHAEPLPEGTHGIASVFPADAGLIDTDAVVMDHLVVVGLRMACRVTPERVFSHRSYYLEHASRPVPVRTAHAFRAGDTVVCFL